MSSMVPQCSSCVYLGWIMKTTSIKFQCHVALIRIRPRTEIHWIPISCSLDFELAYKNIQFAYKNTQLHPVLIMLPNSCTASKRTVLHADLAITAAEHSTQYAFYQEQIFNSVPEYCKESTSFSFTGHPKIPKR